MPYSALEEASEIILKFIFLYRNYLNICYNLYETDSRNSIEPHI